jgi:hypothetical protein
MPDTEPDQRAMHLQNIKARVERADYVVDPAAVAEALLRRTELARDICQGKALRERARSPRAGGRDLPRRG